MKRTRLKKRYKIRQYLLTILSRAAGYLYKIRGYFALALLIATLAYIFIIGFIQTTKTLFNIVAEAPTINKVFAQEREPRLTMTTKEVDNWELFKKKAYELAPIYDYPVKVLLAQAALESKRGQSKFAKERNNFFGYGCYDSDPDKYCAYFENPGEGIIEYLRLIKRDYPEAYNARKNPEKMIQLIWENGYASDPNYVSKVMSMPEWEENE